MTEREAHANTIVTQYATYTAAAGFIPIPIFDIAAITALELKMLSDMARVYNTPFSQDRGKAIVSSLLGGVASTKLAYGVGGSVVRAVPFVGPVLGILTVPAFAYAATYAIGKVFIMHFESGGTLLDFDAEKLRAYFQQQFDKAAGRSSEAAPAA